MCSLTLGSLILYHKGKSDALREVGFIELICEWCVKLTKSIVIEEGSC